MSGQQLTLHTPPVPEAPPAPVTPPENVNAGHTSSPVPGIQDTSENLSGGNVFFFFSLILQMKFANKGKDI